MSDDALQALEVIRNLNKRVLFLTNNPTKSRSQYKEKFESLGIEAARDEVEQHKATTRHPSIAIASCERQEHAAHKLGPRMNRSMDEARCMRLLNLCIFFALSADHPGVLLRSSVSPQYRLPAGEEGVFNRNQRP